MRLTHLVNYDCLLLQLDTKYWLERVEKRINCIQQNAQQGNRSLWNIDHFVSTAKFCINVVSVKYNEKKKLRKSWNFWTSSWIKTDKSLPTFHGDHSIFDHHFSLFCLREWNLWLEMIDTLIINFWRFRWVNEVSRKVLTLLESALQHFEVLKFLWQLSTTSQDQSSATGPVLTKG